MKTAFALMLQYDGLQVIPLDRVCKDYFGGIAPEHYVRQVMSGERLPPVVRLGETQKAAKGVSVFDLATYLDRKIEAARKESEQLQRAG